MITNNLLFVAMSTPKNRIIPVNNEISRHTLKHTTEYSGLKSLVASQWQDC